MSDKNNIPLIKKLNILRHRLFSMEKSRAQGYVNNLSINAQVNLFLTTKPRNRMKLLSLIATPKKVIRKLSDEELYWTIKEVGIKNSFPLFKYSSPDQLHFIFDIECWKSDHLDIKKISYWINILSRSGEQKVIQWFKTFDFDMIIITLKKLIAVYKPREGTDDYGESIEGLPTFTLDGTYFCHFRIKGTEDAIRKMLNVLIAHDIRYYSVVMENIIWGLDDELEYTTYHATQRRLADKGIPEEDDAQYIYRFISDKDISNLPRKNISDSLIHRKTSKSFYPLQLSIKNNLLIITILKKIHDFSFFEDFSLNLAHIANKILVADKFSLSDHSSFKTKIDKAIGGINIGLEFLLQKDHCSGQEILQSYWLEHLFNIGWNRILNLKKVYQTTLGSIDYNPDKNFDALDSPLREIILGINREKPLFYQEKTDACTGYRDFHSLREITQTEDAIHYASFIYELIIKQLGLHYYDFTDSSSILDDTAPHSLSTIFLTGYASKRLNGSWSFSPLDFNTLKQFLDLLFPSSFPNGNYSLQDIEHVIISTVKDSIGSINEYFLEKFVHYCTNKLEHEYTIAMEDGYLDLITFKSLWIQHYYAS